MIVYEQDNAIALEIDLVVLTTNILYISRNYIKFNNRDGNATRILSVPYRDIIVNGCT